MRYYYFGVLSKKKKPSQIAPSLKYRELTATKKDEGKCPFCILYSWVDYTRTNKRPTIFYHVKITTLYLEHTCQMAPQEYHISIQKSGHLEVNVCGMKDILSLMQEKPQVYAETLRPLLLYYVSVHQVI
jgi:hypothetical protein